MKICTSYRHMVRRTRYLHRGAGSGLTIADMEMEIVAQLGFYNSPVRAHGMCGNSKGELFLMPLSTYDRHFLMKLVPVGC